MNEVDLGQRLQAARKAAGLTQQELCHQAELSYSTLTKIERGAIKAPSIFTIQSIAAALDSGLDELLGLAPAGGRRSGAPASRHGVRFVYFDMNGCLVRFYNRSFTLLAADAGVTTDIIQNIFWQYNEAVNRGDKTIEELNKALSDRLDRPVDWSYYYLAATQATPGMHELAAWTAARYQIGILTNTMPGLVEAMLDSGVLPAVSYQSIVDSSLVHALKPETVMYEIAAEKAGVSPAHIMLIDDDNANLAAAGRLGWQTMSFDPYAPDESIAAIRAALD